MEDFTISIQEVPDSGRDDEMAAMRAEVRRREAELPESDEDNEAEREEILQALKRRRKEDPVALATRLLSTPGSSHDAQPSSGSS